MRFTRKNLPRFAAAVLLLAVAGCSVHSVPITKVSETQLKERAISGEKLGFHVMPDASFNFDDVDLK